MSESNSALGLCPFCEAGVRETDVLIEYTDDDGNEAVWAECPSCSEVVDPTHRS